MLKQKQKNGELVTVNYDKRFTFHSIAGCFKK